LKNTKNTYQNLIESLSYKIGAFSIYLRILLFFNMYLFFKGKRKAKAAQMSQAND
jgi:hypothetical protein